MDDPGSIYVFRHLDVYYLGALWILYKSEFRLMKRDPFVWIVTYEKNYSQQGRYIFVQHIVRSFLEQLLKSVCTMLRLRGLNEQALQMCRSYTETGLCSYGKRCRFIHRSNSMSSSYSQPPTRSAEPQKHRSRRLSIFQQLCLGGEQPSRQS